MHQPALLTPQGHQPPGTGQWHNGMYKNRRGSNKAAFTGSEQPTCSIQQQVGIKVLYLSWGTKNEQLYRQQCNEGKEAFSNVTRHGNRTGMASVSQQHVQQDSTRMKIICHVISISIACYFNTLCLLLFVVRDNEYSHAMPILLLRLSLHVNTEMNMLSHQMIEILFSSYVIVSSVNNNGDVIASNFVADAVLPPLQE